MRHLLLAALLASCVRAGAFVCEDDGDCRGATGDGVCESTGYCSFADGVCDSGRRYGELAGGGLGGQCVLGDAADAPVVEPPPDGGGAADAFVGPLSWTAATPLPSPRSIAAAVAFGDRLYLSGGRDDAGLLDEVLVADIRPDGSLGAWTATTPLNEARGWHQSVARDGRVYVIGGDEAGGATRMVEVADVQADGTLGAWRSAGQMPRRLRGHGAAIVGDRLYVVGGEASDGFNLSEGVFSGAFAADGSLGMWAPLASLPGPDYVFALAARDNVLYVTGGFNGDETILRATVQGDGSLDDWSLAGMLPVSRQRHVAFVGGDQLWVVAGSNVYQPAPTYFDDSSSATIAGDGSIGAFTVQDHLTEALRYPAGAMWNGRAYVLGGNRGEDGALVRFALVWYRAL